jgi:hypothetical protein
MKNQTGLLSYPFLEERIHHHVFRHRCQAPMAEVLAAVAEVLLLWRRRRQLLWKRMQLCRRLGGGVRESVGGISARLVQRSLALSYQAPRTHGPNHPGQGKEGITSISILWTFFFKNANIWQRKWTMNCLCSFSRRFFSMLKVCTVKKGKYGKGSVVRVEEHYCTCMLNTRTFHQIGE